MTSRTGNDQHEGQADEGRKPYSKPRILSRDVLEAMATVCSPTPPAKRDLISCSSGPISS